MQGRLTVRTYMVECLHVLRRIHEVNADVVIKSWNVIFHDRAYPFPPATALPAFQITSKLTPIVINSLKRKSNRFYKC